MTDLHELVNVDPFASEPFETPNER
jgi:hypothetical protein